MTFQGHSLGQDQEARLQHPLPPLPHPDTEQAEPVGMAFVCPAAQAVIGHQALWILKEPRASGITSCPWRLARGWTLQATGESRESFPDDTMPRVSFNFQALPRAGGPQATLETPALQTGLAPQLPRPPACSREDHGFGEGQYKRGLRDHGNQPLHATNRKLKGAVVTCSRSHSKWVAEELMSTWGVGERLLSNQTGPVAAQQPEDSDRRRKTTELL